MEAEMLYEDKIRLAQIENEIEHLYKQMFRNDLLEDTCKAAIAALLKEKRVILKK